MSIPIFNSLYPNFENIIKSNKLDIIKLNDLNLHKVDNKRFPAISVIKKLKENDSLYETIIVAANDSLVNLFIKKKIRFIDISIMLLKILNKREFIEYMDIKPKNIADITKLSNYVSVKINSMSI